MAVSANIDYETRTVKVSKSQLVSTVVSLFDTKRIYLTTKSAMKDVILDEIANFEIHVSEQTGVDSYGAKTGSHDDLIMSLAWACWIGERAVEEGAFEPLRVW